MLVIYMVVSKRSFILNKYFSDQFNVKWNDSITLQLNKKAFWYECIIIMTYNRILRELGVEQTKAAVHIACTIYKKEENITISFVYQLQ